MYAVELIGRSTGVLGDVIFGPFGVLAVMVRATIWAVAILSVAWSDNSCAGTSFLGTNPRERNSLVVRKSRPAPLKGS